jgi:hypothetical protein
MSGQTPISPAFRGIRVPAYLILSMAMILPLFDYTNGLVPFHPGDAIWRFGAVSLVASYAVATTAQLFFLFVVATWFEDRKVLYAISAVALLLAVALFAGSGMYGLDALQARSRTSADTQRRLETTAAIALLKLITLFISNAVLTTAAFRGARSIRPAATIPTDRVLMPRPSAAGTKASV